MRIRGMGAGVLAVALIACGSTPPPKAESDVARQPRASALTAAERSLRDRVQAKLAAQLGDDARAIHVHVEGTSLWLSGDAVDGYARDRARDAAHEVPGVTRVDISGLAVR